MEGISYAGKERRRFKRLRIRLAVIYQIDKPLTVRMQIGEKEIMATALDLSEGGMAISTDYDIPLQANLLIKFTLFRVDEHGRVSLYGPMEIIGEVRSNILIEKEMRRLGICFTQLDERDKAEIIDFVKLAFKPKD